MKVYFLDCDGERKQTGTKLHIHRNTLQYRLKKAEGLLGTPLADLSFVIEIYTALALHRLGWMTEDGAM
ncbi:MAG: helix-turn-helix domain-containing protein [Eubacteriales bacterium]